MYTSILVPLDGSALSERALPITLELARRSDARVELFHAHELPPSPSGALAYDTRFDHDEARAMGTSLAVLAERLTRVTGLAIEAVLQEGPAAESLLEHLEAGHVDLIVMASHGRSAIARAGLGSVASHVVRHAPVPVLLIGPEAVAPPERSAFRRIVVPLDGSELAEAALDQAAVLGEPGKTTLLLVRVVQPELLIALPPDPVVVPPIDTTGVSRDERMAMEYLELLRRPLNATGFHTAADVLRAVDVPDAILAFARRHEADLIALAARRHTAVSELVPGSVTRAVIHHAPVPVLVYHPPASSANATPGATAVASAPTLNTC